MKIQHVIKPATLREALIALGDYKGEAEVIAGGTDLLVKMREGHNRYSTLIDISDVPEIREIHETEDTFEIGAAVTFSEIVAHEGIQQAFVGLWEACASVGAPQIRNKGTIGGNIANASPAADSVPPLMALEAVLLIGSAIDSKRVPLSQFFQGKGNNVLQPGEMILKIILQKAPQKHRNVAFAKLGLRNALAISRLSVAMTLTLDDNNQIVTAAVATGSLGLVVMREPLIEAFLIGRVLDDALIEETEAQFSEVVETRLKGRSTCEFKKEAIKGITYTVMKKWMAQEGMTC